jgi:hypothetical protein
LAWEFGFVFPFLKMMLQQALLNRLHPTIDLLPVAK